MDIRNMQFTPMSSGEWIQYISNHALTKEELCWLYCCGLEWRSLLTDPENLPDVTLAMLEKGMDPNQLVTDEPPEENSEQNSYFTPLISSTHFFNDQAAVKSLKLLFEHGGDPNTVYVFDDPGENVFEFYIEDEFANEPDLNQATFYGLLLCMAYGGKQQSGYKPLTMLTDDPVSIFRDYDHYWYEYEENSSSLYVIEKETGKRIAKYH